MGYEINSYPYLRQDSLYNAYMYQFANQNVSNSIPMQYGYYNIQSPIPSFKGRLATQPDTVTFSASNRLQSKKDGMSIGAKWAIGTVAVVGLGALAYALSKGKVGTKQAQQLAEHVDFKPAKTIEEAVKFGEDKLKISYNDYQKANLDMLNTINEMVSKNIRKDKLFDIVHFESYGASRIESPMSFSPISKGDFNASVLRINTDYIDKFDDFIEYVFKHSDGIDVNKIIKRNSNGTFALAKQEYSSEPLNKLIHKLNTRNAKSTYKDKLEIYDGFSELIASYDNILAGKNTMRDFSFDGGFVHEAGHSLHYKSNREMFNSLLDGNNELVKEFHNNNDIQRIAQKVSDYAKTEPLEFVAEVYKGVQKGKTYTDDVMGLYKKYGGPALS